ncbi:hypothetical protein PUN4_840102 [Paraburkholderia unamae]|nr:hypothetical protein PUN4_840102 [Paraburkholderia unamae]
MQALSQVHVVSKLLVSFSPRRSRDEGRGCREVGITLGARRPDVLSRREDFGARTRIVRKEYDAAPRLWNNRMTIAQATEKEGANLWGGVKTRIEPDSRPAITNWSETGPLPGRTGRRRTREARRRARRRRNQRL